MKILITGEGGMLASAFMRIESTATIDIVALSKTDLDITDSQSIVTAVSRYQPTVVINTAAYNAVDRAQVDPQSAMRLNAKAIQDLGSICATNGIFLVHYSSDYVFDGTCQTGYSEHDIPRPISVYGLSKYQGEQALQVIQGLSYYCIRTSRLFGPQGTSMGSKISFPDMVLKRLNAGEPFTSIDAEVSSPTYVDDLAIATIAMLTGKIKGGLYHRTNEGACTWYQWAQEIVNILRSKGTVLPDIEKIDSSILVRAAKRPDYSVLNTTKLPPLRTWQEALEEYLNKSIN